VEIFLKATYPEATKPGWYSLIQIERVPYAEPWKYPLVDVSLYNYSDVPGSRALTKDGALHARWESGDDGRVKSVVVEGAIVHSKTNDDLAALVAEHREWSQASVRAELVRRGARFVTDEAGLRNALPLKEWESLFGPLRIQALRLSVPDASEDGASRPGELRTYWEAVLESPDRARYYLSVEPFAGKVTRLYRVKDTFELGKH
jgi:hypothetical protein